MEAIGLYESFYTVTSQNLARELKRQYNAIADAVLGMTFPVIRIIDEPEWRGWAVYLHAGRRIEIGKELKLMKAETRMQRKIDIQQFIREIVPISEWRKFHDAVANRMHVRLMTDGMFGQPEIDEEQVTKPPFSWIR